MVVRVEVSPDLLQWAGRRARLDSSELAGRFPKYPEWESGATRPTLRQLEAFASATHTPFGYFLLDAPPDLPLPVTDFRTLASQGVAEPSPDLLDTIQICRLRQAWYHDYLVSEGAQPPPWVGSLTTEVDPVEAAALIAHDLNFEAISRDQFATWTDAFRHLIERAEVLGALVMVNGIVGSNTHRKLDPDEFRGFSLVDDYAPLVFVNGADSKAAQIFTLIHELAHLWLGDGGVSDASMSAVSSNPVERWCNAVAAEVLAPIAALVEAHQPGATWSDEVSRLARRFKASTLVIMFRLVEAGLISRPEFERLRQEELQRLAEVQVTRASGGDYYRTQPRRVSRTFATALLTSAFNGTTSFGEAMRLLGIKKASTLSELAHQLDVA